MENSAEKRKAIEVEIEGLKMQMQENSQLIYDLERRVSVIKARNQIKLKEIYKLFDQYQKLI